MKKYLFMKPVLEYVSEGRHFKGIFTLALRILAAVIALAGLISFIFQWETVFKLSKSGVIGGIFFQLFYLASIYMVVHVILIRADEIAKTPDAEYMFVPMISTFFKLLGEAYASFATAIALGGGIFTWFAGTQDQEFLKGIFFGGTLSSKEGSFLAGILYMAYRIFSAFGALLSAYVLSELAVIIVDIARNRKAKG